MRASKKGLACFKKNFFEKPHYDIRKRFVFKGNYVLHNFCKIDPNLVKRISQAFSPNEFVPQKIPYSTILHRAAQYDNAHFLKEFLARAPHLINFLTLENCTILHIACNYGNYTLAENLLTMGADPEIINETKLPSILSVLNFSRGFIGQLEYKIDAMVNNRQLLAEQLQGLEDVQKKSLSFEDFKSVKKLMISLSFLLPDIELRPRMNALPGSRIRATRSPANAQPRQPRRRHKRPPVHVGRFRSDLRRRNVARLADQHRSVPRLFTYRLKYASNMRRGCFSRHKNQDKFSRIRKADTLTLGSHNFRL